MKKVLLTSTCGPFELGWGEDMHDIMSSRLARGQGPFTLSSHCHYWGLYLIAENLSNAQVTVLENPHFDEFEEELRKGYDFWGFQLKSILTASAVKMMKRARELAPKTKIVAGGYGVGALGDPVPGDTEGHAKYITENADYICREEGARFFRRLLDDEPVERPITQWWLPLGGATLKGFPLFNMNNAPFLVALGCPNGCEFCNTSAFFHQKKIYVSNPKETADIMRHYKLARLKDRPRVTCALYDEDFYLDKPYVEELGKHLAADEEAGLGKVNYFSFGSMRSLAQYTPEEMLTYGSQAIWIGVESSLEDVITSHHSLTKRSGNDIKRTFDELHEHGIMTTASMILGFDFHDKDNIEKDIDYFISLEPVFYQISPLTPCPGTPLYRKLQEEGRMYDDFTWKDVQIWKDDIFKVKNFEKGGLRPYFDKIHKRLYEENGPSMIRFLKYSLQGLRTCTKSTNPLVKRRLDAFREGAEGLYPLLTACIKHAPTKMVEEKAREIKAMYIELIGQPNSTQEQLGEFFAGVIEQNLKKMNTEEWNKISDPPVRWTYYNPGRGDGPPVVVKGRKEKARLDKLEASKVA